MNRLLACALLCSFLSRPASAAPDEVPPPLAEEAWPLHASLSAGAGHAYDYLGLRAELRYSHAAIFFALGTPALTRPDARNPGQDHCPGPWAGGREYPDSSYAGGFRYYHQPGRGGLYAGLQFSFRGTCIGGLSDDGDPPGFHNYLTFSATLGYRFRFGPFFLDAGGGPAITDERLGYPGSPNSAGRFNGFVYRSLTLYHPGSPLLALLEIGFGVEL